MKTAKYLLMVLTTTAVLSVYAQTVAQQPTTEFHSTSSMAGSGSTLPMAVQDGAYTTYDVNYNASRANKPGLRKDGDNPGGGFNGGGEGEPDDRDEPWENPIGDAAWPLALLALVYGVWCMVYRRKRV